jgi:cytochrome c
MLFVGAALSLAAFTTPEPNIIKQAPPEVDALLSKYSCTSCHAMERKLVGPTWKDIAAKKYTKKRIIQLVKNPEPANWPGYPAMAPQATVPKEDIGKIADWLVSLSK